METVNIHEAKTHLSRLIQKAVDGEPCVIARAGKPLVKVMALEPKEKVDRKSKMGFLKGKNFKVPGDFKAFAREEIEEMFYGNPDRFSSEKLNSKDKR